MPTPSGKTQAKRPLTQKELRAVRRRRRDREKRDRIAQGIRPVWSLPAGQSIRRNYIITLVLVPLALGAGTALRLARLGLPLTGQMIIGAVVWAIVIVFIVWSFHKAFPY